MLLENRFTLQRLSNARDLQRKKMSRKPKFWWTSVISASLATVFKVYLKKQAVCVTKFDQSVVFVVFAFENITFGG